MSHIPQDDDTEQTQRLLSQLRGEFDGIRERETAVRVRLIHKATNAEADGVKGSPPAMLGSVGGSFTAGQRDGWPNLDDDGNQVFVDPPLLDPAGTPIVNSTGQGLDWTMPASRTVEFSGDRGAVSRLRSLAERGGQLAVAWRNETQRLLAGWRFSAPEDRWWALLFELAWSGRHPLLTAKRQLWLTDEKGQVLYLPYDARELAAVCSTWKGIPDRWLKRLPDAFMSEIGDAASACSDLAGVVLDQYRATESHGLPRQSAVEVWNQLSDRQRNCLQALDELHALDADHRGTADDIATRAEGTLANVNGFKEPLSDLVTRRLLVSKIGREGGYWLSAAGRELIEAAEGGATTDNASN